jgi:guanine nucleotide-binding protein subunit alpha, other
MQEALILFESMSNSRWFTKTALILFLNKMDLFKKKLESSPISKYFSDYEGDCTNIDVASRFFQDKFLRLNRNPNKVITLRMPMSVATN